MHQYYAVIIVAALLVPASAAPSWKLPKAPANVAQGHDMKSEILSSNPNMFKGTEDAATVRAMFEEWRTTFQKSYTSPTAFSAALANFKDNLIRAAAINANKDVSYWADLNNQFADVSFEEFQARYLMKTVVIQGTDISQAASASAGSQANNMGRKMLQKKGGGGGNSNPKPSPAPSPSPSPAASPVPSPTPSPAPSPVPAMDKDWRLEGKITPVKDQGNCGSCWAFAASAAIESAYHITKGTSADTSPVDVSEQQLVSCANSAYGYFSGGCNGGGSDDAMNYVFNVNQTNEATYPYTSGATATTGACDFNLLSGVAAGNALKLGGGVVYLARNNQLALMNAVNQQPVVVYFDVASDFYSYSSGVYSPSSGCMDGINHAMVVVGYKWTGNTATSFWIVRNSWGTWWGDAGYVNIQMTGDGSGPCLMHSYPMAPVLKFTQSFTAL